VTSPPRRLPDPSEAVRPGEGSNPLPRQADNRQCPAITALVTLAMGLSSVVSGSGVPTRAVIGAYRHWLH